MSIVIGLALLCLASAAQADASWYSSFDYGAAILGTVPASMDQTAHGYRLAGGYGFNRYFSLETGYVDFGKAANGDTAGQYFGFIDSQTQITTKAHGVTFDVVATLPVNDRVSLSARLGILFSVVEVDVSAPPGPPIPSRSDSSNHGDMGVGISYRLSNRWSVHYQWTQYLKLKDPFNGNAGTYSLSSLGVTYSFP